MWLHGGLKTYWQEKAALIVTIETVIISMVQSQHSSILVHGVLYTLSQNKTYHFYFHHNFL